MENIQDPERKLRLFAEYHKAKVAQDAARDKEKTGDEGHWWSHNKEQNEHQRQNAARAAIVKSTQREVDFEVAFLLGKAGAGQLSAADVQKYIDSKTQEHAEEMKTQRNQTGTLEGLSDEDRVHYMRIHMEQALLPAQKGSLTAEQAHLALATIQDLPRSLQAKVLEALDERVFEGLLNHLSDGDLLANSLLKSIHDPERKLKLWSKSHLAKVKIDADIASKQQRAHRRLDPIVATTEKEVREEAQFLLKAQKQGGALQEADVDKLIARKEHEHRVEMKYGVNITNDITGGNSQDPAKKPSERVTWSDAELGLLDAGLARLPAEHVGGNENLHQLRRSKMHMKWHGEKKEWREAPAAGWEDSQEHSVHFTDAGVRAASSSAAAATSALAHHRKDGAGRDAPASYFEETIAHEIGHNIHSHNPALFQRYQNAAGWEGLNEAALMKRLQAPITTCWKDGAIATQVKAEPDELIKKLDEKRTHEHQDRACFVGGDKEYQVDPYGSGYLGVNKGAVPEIASWSYARSHPYEHFAEHYAKAVHDPENLFKDLVTTPQDHIVILTNMRNEFKKRGVSAAHIEKVDAFLQSAQAQKESGAKQWSLMREEVFHLKPADVESRVEQFSRKAPPGKESLVDEFRTQAAMCMTPQQLADLEEEYNARL